MKRMGRRHRTALRRALGLSLVGGTALGSSTPAYGVNCYQAFGNFQYQYASQQIGAAGTSSPTGWAGLERYIWRESPHVQDDTRDHLIVYLGAEQQLSGSSGPCTGSGNGTHCWIQNGLG